MKIKINKIFIAVIIPILIISCKKEINYIQDERKFITENQANISIKGIYLDHAIDENYTFLISKEYVGSSDSYFIRYLDNNQKDTIPCKIINFSLFTQNLSSEVKFYISFNYEYLFVDTQFSLLKIYDNNQILRISSFYNYPPFPVKSPFHDYKSEVVKYNDENKTLSFNISYHFIRDSSTNYHFNGSVELKYYELESFY